MEAHLILQPVFVVGLLTIIITIWMYFTRVPAMKKLRIHPQRAQDTDKLRDLLPMVYCSYYVEQLALKFDF